MIITTIFVVKLHFMESKYGFLPCQFFFFWWIHFSCFPIVFFFIVSWYYKFHTIKRNNYSVTMSRLPSLLNTHWWHACLQSKIQSLPKIAFFSWAVHIEAIIIFNNKVSLLMKLKWNARMHAGVHWGKTSLKLFKNAIKQNSLCNSFKRWKSKNVINTSQFLCLAKFT